MVQARRREEGLDETDRMIVAELQENARISNVELAKRVNLSPTPCYERVRKLERTGVVWAIMPVLIVACSVSARPPMRPLLLKAATRRILVI